MGLDDFIHAGFSNTDFYEEMYKRYREDPLGVDRSWREFFQRIDAEEGVVAPQLKRPASTKKEESPLAFLDEIRDRQRDALHLIEGATLEKESDEIRVYNLIQAYRTYGHLLAHINPIQTIPRKEPRELNLAVLGFSEKDLDKVVPTCGLLKESAAPLREIIRVLREIYCANIGVEYMGLHSFEMEEWLQQHIEPNLFRIDLTIEQKQMILQHLNKSGLFEWFLQTKYVGQKRFSLEGGETLIPIFAAIIEYGADLGMEEFIVGMAHRGRLNILCNILDKSYSDIFSEFEDSYIPESFEGSGDVKYHKGFSSEILTSHGHRVQVSLTPNPSHLESVDPVVEGQVRSKQVLCGDLPKQERVVPILVHGDAALAGQGVVYETMQFCRLKGYATGGTVHIVINNQIGFTTLPVDARSTPYCTDVAKTFGAPVFHVNAEDPEGCVYATILALEMRQRFHCDVFIDLNCYRKYGHNEADEPAFTQPLEYQMIRKKKPIREIYRDHLIQQGVLEKYLAEELEAEFKKGLQQALKGTKELHASKPKEPVSLQKTPPPDLFQEVQTAVPLKELQQIAQAISVVPEGFNIHRKLHQIAQNRLAMVMENGPEKMLDWGMAELLAYGSLLLEKVHVRVSGQDCCRGTFSHRHAMWMDQKEERGYYPLMHIKEGQGLFSIYNSSLSEYAVLGFEYGYSLGYPSALVIWEAQFGDFSNGAQIIIDQYLSTSEQKWGQTSNLVLLLPHGYEGQGPEHSSARIERFLTLCGDYNMTVVNPTTPAQFFHLLRKQILTPLNRPLIIFTPKALLRHPKCVNMVEDLSEGTFQEVMDDPMSPQKVKRIAFCSGKIYYDLLEEREKTGIKDIALVRIEQLYPLHIEKIEAILRKYSDAEVFLWVQEEPRNMGPWNHIRPAFRDKLERKISLQYVGRRRSASPATGSLNIHKNQLRNILQEVFPGKEQEIDHSLHHPV